jgi:hypothetical protein
VPTYALERSFGVTSDVYTYLHQRRESTVNVKEATNLSLEIMLPATATDRAQLPRMMLYWCRVAQSPIFSFVVRPPHRASSSAASLSSSDLPAPVLRGVRRQYSVQELGLTSVHGRILNRAFQPGWISKVRSPRRYP